VKLRSKVHARDGGCLLRERGGCFGGLTVHHLRKRSQGGADTEANLVTLCAGHNVWVEDHPEEAWGLGLVARRGESLGACWARMNAAGLTPWTDYDD
jgi:5-methylcytosine-specific restriction endonuclease McrA